MKPMFVELSELRDARNLWDVACVTFGKNSHRLYVRTSGSFLDVRHPENVTTERLQEIHEYVVEHHQIG